jgi:glutamate 5-kinase
VGVGCQRLRLATRPDSLAQKQALAAVGQVHLMRYYDDLFTAVDMVRGGWGVVRRLLLEPTHALCPMPVPPAPTPGSLP